MKVALIALIFSMTVNCGFSKKQKFHQSSLSQAQATFCPLLKGSNEYFRFRDIHAENTIDMIRSARRAELEGAIAGLIVGLSWSVGSLYTTAKSSAGTSYLNQALSAGQRIPHHLITSFQNQMQFEPWWRALSSLRYSTGVWGNVNYVQVMFEKMIHAGNLALRAEQGKTILLAGLAQVGAITKSALVNLATDESSQRTFAHFAFDHTLEEAGCLVQKK